MENKKNVTATQQPLTQQHLMAHHVHPDQIYSPQHSQLPAHLHNQSTQIQPNGVMHHLLQSQYNSNMNARSPLLENRHEMYGTGQNHDYARHYGANDNLNYMQSPPRLEKTEIHVDQNVNHELLQNMPKGYNAEVYQDYLKRNPPKDSNQIYQNHQHTTYRHNVNQYGSKPYLPYSNRIGPQSNTELLRRQYNEIQQMKMQQQMHYQNQAQMHQQQKFAERQLLLQQIHGVQPPPNLQNSIYSDSSYRDLYSSKNDFKDYSSSDVQKDIDIDAKNNEHKDREISNRQYQETQWQSNQPDFRETERQNQQEYGKSKSQSPPTEYHKNSPGMVSPMKSSESSTPSIKSPSLESRRSSSGTQALRSPTAQRIPSAPVTMAGLLYKQGSDGLKVWRKRWFVLSEYCLFYYKNQDEEKLLGSVLLPSYRVSACTADDKVMRKFAFKLEHANMRTYVLAALDQEAMLKWVKALTMAALMQNSTEHQQKQNDRAGAKTEEDDEEAGPTYANAPPKPRRSNDGYNSPSPDMYDPNYDLLKKPASHYSQGTNHTRYPDTNYSTKQEIYTRNPQSPPTQMPNQTKRPYDTQNLSLPLINTVSESLGKNHTPSMYKSNPQSPYFDNRKNQQQHQQDNKIESIYEKQPNYNPFLQDYGERIEQKHKDDEVNRQPPDANKTSIQNEIYPESRVNTKPYVDSSVYGREVYGDLNNKVNKTTSTINERLAERRTPDAYRRSTTMSPYNTEKIGDYEDIYTAYDNGKLYAKSPNLSRDAVSLSSHKSPQEHSGYTQEKVFTGPSVLRRKKMQASGIQPPMPRPHSADFLEYESKNEVLNKTIPARSNNDPPKQPQRPKSSLDINSYYDPSSDKYYSEESYAQKMRQSAQYLQQQGIGPRNIQIPLEKYASGLAEKQLQSPYAQTINNNYETEFNVNRNIRDNVSYNSKYSDLEGMNSNWTLKEKGIEKQKDYLNRSGSVMSDGSNVSGFVKDANRYDPNVEGFIRSASARLPSSTEREGEKKIQQREESMKRLLEWKQRMLQSPLTRKSTPATISLARSLNQSRQSLRSDQYKPKTYNNASYNSYSSDDEEETPGTDLQNTRDMQAGRSHNVNVTSPTLSRLTSPHALSSTSLAENMYTDQATSSVVENTYENILCTISLPKLVTDVDSGDDESKNIDFKCNETEVEPPISRKKENQVNSSLESQLSDNEGYETHDSESDSETHIEYTDNDLDEVLLASDNEVENFNESVAVKINTDNVPTVTEDKLDEKSKTPPVRLLGEDHYLPMSPRKISTIEPAHKTILENISIFDESMPQNYEDNPYVEMNVANEEDDMQTYEIVCVNNEKAEPVYMELSNVISQIKSNEDLVESNTLLDTASSFANTKEQTLKRVSREEKSSKEKLDVCEPEEEDKEMSLDLPFNRFSISDNFRPASYYLSGSRSILERPDRFDGEIVQASPVPNSSPLFDDMLDEELSKYILDKLDKSDISQDNSIIKMLTRENQKMNKIKKKTTSLMIYSSHTSIHETLSRGEKIRNSRASLTSENNKYLETSSQFLNNSIIEQMNNSGNDNDSLRSNKINKERSRLSLESDGSSKFDAAPSTESDSMVDLRDPYEVSNFGNEIKRRPLSNDSIYELNESEIPNLSNDYSNINLDTYLQTLHCPPSEYNVKSHCIGSNRISTNSDILHKNNSTISNENAIGHNRSLSTPVSQNLVLGSDDGGSSLETHTRWHNKNGMEYTGSQSSCSSIGLPMSPFSFYRKDYNGDTMKKKNLNNNILADKTKDFDSDKLSLRPGLETASSSATTGFHSRESSTEHSAPYYYSDLSSQEHINVLPVSHFLKNTNIHRKLNNQRRRVPTQKKNEISHIHNPIRSNQIVMSDQPFDLAASARSVSVEFLSAVEKNPDFDFKNIYESTSNKASKIPESMNLISSLSCKKSSNKNNYDQITSPNQSIINQNNVQRISTGSMSSHCSENSSNTVYYDAETETSPYENIMYHGEKHWDEDILWRDNLRRVSHRHARSMDDLDATPTEGSILDRPYVNATAMNSIKRVKKSVLNKTKPNSTYVNCDIQAQVQINKEINSQNDEKNENDVYVSLAKDSEFSREQTDEGVYEQLTVESTENSPEPTNFIKNRRKFEIDRENLRQWDLMSSGLMKGELGRVRSTVVGMRASENIGSYNTDNGTDNASNEASMTMSATNIESSPNNNTNNHTNQQNLSKKSFLGSNTSIGRSNRDGNIPVRAVSPRVRWVEEKPSNEQYDSQQITTSQQNLNMSMVAEESWVRSPSRAQQQPIRAVSPRIRRNTENDDMRKEVQNQEVGDIPTAGELLGRSHEELVLLLIQLRRRHAATHRAIDTCCAQISSIEDCLSSLKAMEREESLQRLEQLKMQLMELENQYEKSKPLVQLVDNMVKLGSLYNRPGSTIERLERNQRLRQKVLAEHALEQQRWLESAAAGKPLETEAARVRVAELWALEQELADEAAILQGLKTDKDAIDSLLTGVRSKLDSVSISGRPQTSSGLEVELARVHAMLAHNSKKLEQTVADNARLERELHHLRRALRAQRASAAHAHAHPTALLEDEVSRVQHLVSALQRQRQELSRAVRHLTQQSHALQTTHDSMPGKRLVRNPTTSWQETNLDTGHTIDHGQSDYDYDMSGPILPPGHYSHSNVETPLYVDTRTPGMDVASPINSEDMQHSAFGNLSNVEKQEIKTVRIVKRESERRQRDRERSLQPMSDWSTSNITANLDQFLEEELVQPINNYRASSLPRTDYNKYEEYYTKPQSETPNYLRYNEKNMNQSPKYPSSPSLSNYDYSRDISSLSSSYHKSYDKYDRTVSLSTQYLNSPTDSSRTLTNDPLSKTSSIVSLTRSNMELSPIFKSEAAKQIITEMSGDKTKNGSLHRRQVPKEKRRHYTAPHHLSAKTLNEMPKDAYNQDALARSLDDADMERALRGAAPDVVRSALPSRKIPDSIDQLLAAPQKIIIPERYIPEKPPELSPEEQQKRQEKVESIKKMLTGSSADQNKSPDGEEKRQREHLLQMNQILAKQVTEMSKIIAVKALEELPLQDNTDDYEDRSPDVELPIYQQRDNFFT
ncbi:unnamed protein product [Euphydryas editha]|uniref:PH domain-containing protein n=1 Tax=Euphydryas editha TaxID=104508 RepID=A0AAU9UBP4_EUPED|nr:unnamed protein product [Euphydryas editha]